MSVSRAKITKADEAQLRGLHRVARRYRFQASLAASWRAKFGSEMHLPGALEELRIASEAASAEIQAILSKYR